MKHSSRQGGLALSLVLALAACGGGSGGSSGSGSGGTPGGLSSTGVDAMRAVLAAAALTMIGTALVRRRRAMGPQLGAS